MSTPVITRTRTHELTELQRKVIARAAGERRVQLAVHQMGLGATTVAAIAFSEQVRADGATDAIVIAPRSLHVALDRAFDDAAPDLNIELLSPKEAADNAAAVLAASHVLVEDRFAPFGPVTLAAGLFRDLIAGDNSLYVVYHAHSRRGRRAQPAPGSENAALTLYVQGAVVTF